MAVSKVAICNYALATIGAKLITALDNSTAEGRQCLARYDMARDAILEMFPWSFAVAQATLVQTAATPTFGYAYNFALPTNCLRPLKIEQNYKYEIVGRNLQTDSDSVSLWYIDKVEDPSKYTPLFDSLLAYRLAKDIAMPLTGDKNTRDYAETEYRQSFLEAVTVNADFDEEVDETTSYLEVRD